MRVSVGRQPFVLLMQHFEGAVDHVIEAAIGPGAQRLRDAVFLFGLSLESMRCKPVQLGV